MAILTGYKAIQKYCGGKDKKTILKWIKLYKLPVLRLENQVCALPEEINEWFSSLRKASFDDGKYHNITANLPHKRRTFSP